MKRMVIVWVLGVFICSVALDAILSSSSSSRLYAFFETVLQVDLSGGINVFLSHIPPLLFFCGLVLVFVRATGKSTRGVGKTVAIACLMYTLYCISFILLEGIVVSNLILGGQFGDQDVDASQKTAQAIFWTHFLRYFLWVLAYGVATRLAIKEKLGVGTRRFIATCALLVGACLVLSFFDMAMKEARAILAQTVMIKPFWMVKGAFSWEWALKFLFFGRHLFVGSP